MTDEQPTHLVINYIWIENNEITVGATDNLRWKWDTEDGMSGGDAKTIVFVVLKDYLEKTGFHCLPGDPVRELAMSHLFELFDIAWAIRNDKDDLQTAGDKYFGMELK